MDDSSEHDDEIYVFEDNSDSQTLLDLQLELALVRKKLKVTEMAYRALENEFVALSSSNNSAIVLLSDVQFAEIALSDATNNNDHGVRTALRLIECIRKNLIDQGEQEDLHVVLLLHPHKVKKLYMTLSPSSAASLLSPYIISAIDNLADSNTSASPSLSSPSVRRRRSWSTSASSFSTSLFRAASNKDSLLSKIVLLQPSMEDVRSRAAILEVRSAVVQACSDSGREQVLKDVLDADFDTLFNRIELPDIFQVALPPQPTISKEVHPVWGNPVHEITTSPLIQKQPISPPKPIAAPTASPAATYTEAPATAPAPAPVPIDAPPPPTPTPAESKWAEVVRKGKKNLNSSPEMGITALPPTSPVISHQGEQAPASNGFLAVGSGASVLQEISPNKAKKTKTVVASPKKDATPKPSAQQPVELDPNVSLCRQKKPPCNQFYLTKRGCTNPKCNYSHTYKLNDKQLEELRSGAARTACVYRKTGVPCMGGEDCVFGHKCPQGNRCKQGSKCHFPAHMH